MLEVMLRLQDEQKNDDNAQSEIYKNQCKLPPLNVDKLIETNFSFKARPHRKRQGPATSDAVFCRGDQQFGGVS